MGTAGDPIDEIMRCVRGSESGFACRPVEPRQPVITVDAPSSDRALGGQREEGFGVLANAVLHFANNVHAHVSAFSSGSGTMSDDTHSRYAEAHWFWLKRPPK